MSEKRSFKGIWIPAKIWLSKELSIQEKVFLVEIDSLDNNDGCWASNGYFSKFFNLSKNRVSVIIRGLIQKNFITSKIIYKKDTKEVIKRILRISYTTNPPPPESNVTPPIGSNNTPPVGNNNYNNPSSNNPSSNKELSGEAPAGQSPEKDKTKKKTSIIIIKKAKKILTQLNSIGKKSRGFSPIDSNLKHIISRLKDGYSFKDCIQVLETKILDPYFKENPKYFNPQTLFRPANFEKYLNEDPKQYNKKEGTNRSGLNGEAFDDIEANVVFLTPERVAELQRLDDEKWGKPPY